MIVIKSGNIEKKMESDFKFCLKLLQHLLTIPLYTSINLVRLTNVIVMIYEKQHDDWQAISARFML